MARINLLPWRDERRAEQKKEFVVVLAAVAVFAALIILLAQMVASGYVDNQNSRNEYLQSNINELNAQVKEIKELENKRRELLDRMKIIQELQGNRPVIVRVFDEIVRTIPDGVFYLDLKRTENTIQMTGVAESNNRISSLMRRIDGSEWFANPILTSVQARPQYGEQASEFKLSFAIKTPSDETEGGVK